MRFDPGPAGHGLSPTITPSLGAASQGAGRLWGMQDLGRLVPYGSPFDMAGQFAAALGYGMPGPRGRGTGTPYAGVTQSGIGYRAMHYASAASTATANSLASAGSMAARPTWCRCAAASRSEAASPESPTVTPALWRPAPRARG